MISLAVLFLAAAGVARGQDQPLEEKIKKGWEAIGHGEFALAERLFSEAITMAPDKPEGYRGRGMSLLRRSQGAPAAEDFLRAQELGSDYADLDLDIGRAHYLAGDLHRAIAHLEAYRALHPGAWQVYEVLGMSYYETGQYDRCIEAFSNELLNQQPAHEMLYVYYLGMAYHARGDSMKAGPYFKRLLSEYPATVFALSVQQLLAVEEGERDLWARDRRRVAEQKWWWISAGLEYTYDTNPLSIGSGGLAPDVGVDRNAATLEVSLGAGAYLLQRADLLWSVQAGYVQKWHNNLAEFDQDEASVSTFAEYWPADWVGITASASATDLRVGSEETRDRWSVGPGVYIVEAPWTRTHVHYSHENIEYFLERLTPAQDVDADPDTLGISQDAVLPGTDLRLVLSYAHTWQDADGADYDADFDSGSFSAGHPLFWDIYGTLSVRYTSGDYHERNSRSDPAGSERRDDDIWTMSVRFQRPITEWMTVHLGASMIDAESNLDIFDYDRAIYVGGVDFRF